MKTQNRAFDSNSKTHSAGPLAEPSEAPLLVQGNNAFAAGLYENLRATSGNLLFSPYSISSALSMGFAGAGGATARQMEEVLHFPRTKTSLPGLHAYLNAALEAARTRSGTELSVANSLWPQKECSFRREFLDVLEANYGVTLTGLDYARDLEAARATINRWISERTRQKINKVIGPDTLNVLTRMVMVNAIYFKAEWETPFTESLTRRDAFYVDPNQFVRVPFMDHSGSFAYSENEQLQVLCLPYAAACFEMVILLPRERNGLERIEMELARAGLAPLTSTLHRERLRVVLPRFKMSNRIKLKQTLEALGLRDAFDPEQADFSGVDGRSRGLYLDDVLHAAFIEVNEKGTEAGAFSALLAMEFGPRKEVEFRADHPFLFCIRDTTTGSLLFFGRFAKPEDELG